MQIVEEDLANLHALGLEFSWIYRAEAMLAAYENDPDAMIEALKRVLKHGYRDPMLFRDPIFDAARDDPRFIAVQQELDDLLNVEREKALQMMEKSRGSAIDSDCLDALYACVPELEP